MDETTARRVCSLIAGVLTADGEMGPKEREYLKRAMVHCGLETDTVLMATYGEDIAEELAQLDEPTRWEALNLAIHAAAADGTINPAERAFVDAIARELKLPEEQVVERLGLAVTQSTSQP